jgi:hypothetical protein
MRPSPSPAMHNRADAQERYSKSPMRWPFGLGVTIVGRDHDRPFHMEPMPLPMLGPLPSSKPPPATQKVGLGHEMEFHSPSVPIVGSITCRR